LLGLAIPRPGVRDVLDSLDDLDKRATVRDAEAVELYIDVFDIRRGSTGLYRRALAQPQAWLHFDHESSRNAVCSFSLRFQGQRIAKKGRNNAE
jgi:hypothetical protein